MSPIKIALSLVLCLTLSSCSGFDPTGIYQGDDSENAGISVPTGPPNPDGSLTVNSTSTSRSHQGVQVVISRASERRLRAQLGSCAIEIEQQESPNEHNGSVLAAPPQVCTIAVDGFNGPMTMSGDVLFDRVNNTIELHLSGTPQDTNISGSYGYSFNGRRQP